MDYLKSIVGKLMFIIQKLSLTVFTDIGDQLAPVFYRGLTLFIVFYGLGMIIKKIERDFYKFGMTAFICALAIQLATNVDLYKEWILTPILGTAIDISEFILKSVADAKFTDMDSFSFLDGAYQKLTEYSANMKPSGNALTNLGLYIEVYAAKFLLWGFFFFFALTFFLYFLVCWSIIYLLSMFAGVFFLLACFEKTRSFAGNWLKTIIAAGITIILAHAVLGLTIGGLDKAFSQLTFAELTQGAFNDFFMVALCWCVVASLLMLMVPQITQGLTAVSFSIGGAAIAGAVGGVSLAKMKAAGGKAAGYGLDSLKGGGAVRGAQNMYGNATEMLRRMRGIA